MFHSIGLIFSNERHLCLADIEAVLIYCFAAKTMSKLRELDVKGNQIVIGHSQYLTLRLDEKARGHQDHVARATALACVPDTSY